MNMSMKEMLLELKEKALADLEAAASSQELQDLKVKYLGRKGPMTEILRGMGHYVTRTQTGGRASASHHAD